MESNSGCNQKIWPPCICPSYNSPQTIPPQYLNNSHCHSTNGKITMHWLTHSVDCRSLIDDRSHLLNTVVSIELTFHFLSRKMCDKIPSYINLPICLTVLFHERENYIGLTVAKAVVYAIDERSMDCIFEIAWFRSNWRNTILYALVLSFSSGANCPEIVGGNCPGRIVRGANCPDTETTPRWRRLSI